MNDGAVYRQGTVSEVFAMADDLTAVGLDVPMVSRIAHELKNRGIELDGEIYTVDGAYKAIMDYIGRSVEQ